MKKLICLFAALLVAAGALTVTSCATANDDLAPASIPGYIVGGFGNSTGISVTPTASGTNNFYPISFTDGVATFKFTQGSDGWTADFSETSMHFQVTEVVGWDAGWVGKTLELNGDYVELTAGKPSNNEVTGLVKGNTYTISVKQDGSKVSVKIEGEAAKATDADVSALNSTTAAQTGAYFRVGGDSYSDVSKQTVYFKDGKATGYIVLPKGATGGWDNTKYFQFYAYFGAGDNGSSLNNAEKQLNFGETTLGKSLAITTSATGNLKVMDMESSASATSVFKFVVTTTSSGATITVTKVE